MQKKKIAIIGTQGLPNKYGGFETLVEYLVEYLSSKYDITVFCLEKIYPNKVKYYKGCKLQYISLNANRIQSIPYDIISMLKAVKKYDRILVLGASGGLIFPFLSSYKEKFILNFGGLDWQRSKWNYFAKKVLKLSEKLAVQFSGHIIADNPVIQKYIKKTYQRESTFIAYGGNQALAIQPDESDYERYSFLKYQFAFSVARIQKDNNIDMILDAFYKKSSLPIVFVGNWSKSDYGVSIKKKYSAYQNIILLDAIYNQRELDLLRSNCSIYIHGHSAGGTNPSLVEAMYLGLPILAFSSSFNEYTTNHKAMYFSSSKELPDKLQNVKSEQLKLIGNEMKSIAVQNYKWETIAKKYSEIFEI